MATSITPTTELEAINLMLSTIGEAPLSTLQDISGVADGVLAANILSEISRAVQSRGWHFNTEVSFPLVPDAFTKEINLPPAVVRIDTVGESRDIDLVQRGTRLYNRKDKTFQFEKTIYVDAVLLLPFDDLPETARHYIAIRAARVFQSRNVGSPTLFEFTQRDEALALAALKKAEMDTGDYNILTGSYSVMRVLNRF